MPRRGLLSPSEAELFLLAEIIYFQYDAVDIVAKVEAFVFPVRDKGEYLVDRFAKPCIFRYVEAPAFYGFEAVPMRFV